MRGGGEGDGEAKCRGRLVAGGVGRWCMAVGGAGKPSAVNDAAQDREGPSAQRCRATRLPVARPKLNTPVTPAPALRCRWKGKLTVKEMCEDQWRWASQNPEGFLTKK